MPGNVTQILSSSDEEQIHQTSMRLLAEVGVEFPCDQVLAVFDAHSIRTDGSRVYLSEDQLERALGTVPRQFTIHARNPARDVTVGDGEPVFAPGYGAPFLVDVELGKRTPTLADYHDLAKLAHALPHQDLSGHLLAEPRDVPAHTVHLHMLHAHMVHSDKPFIGSSESAAGARHTLEMATILFGQEMKERPVTIGLINSLTPLGYSQEMLESLLVYTRARQPVMIAALAMAGSSAPITLAGTLALQNAELLAGVALAQLISPGIPVVFGSTSTNIDMRSGTLAIGSPELAMLSAAHAQMARRYGLPSRGGGALTDANYPDAQAGLESMMGLLTAIHSGMDFVLHAGGILSSYLAFSYEKFVLDDEICGMVRHFRRGFAVDPGTLAREVSASVGPGGNFLMEPHTVKRCRREFWMPEVCDRDGLEAWMDNGRKDAVTRARQRWQQLVAEHEDPPLDDTTARQLRAFVDERAS